MKLKELKQALEFTEDDYDLEIFIGHATYEVSGIHVAEFGKSVALHACLECEKLRLILVVEW
jgi:hypothetical protein